MEPKQQKHVNYPYAPVNSEEECYGVARDLVAEFSSGKLHERHGGEPGTAHH